MKPSPEELAAFADGELSGEREAQVAALVDADPALADEIARHRRLKTALGAHFAPVLDQPVPDRLSKLLQTRQADVADFAAARERREAKRRLPRWSYLAAARERREAKRRLPRWSYLAAPAIAAALALAVFGPRSDGGPGAGYADARLASALDSQLVASQPADAPTKVLLSFVDKAGQYCRVFRSSAQAGIACRDNTGWQLIDAAAGANGDSTQYRQAGSADADLFAKAQGLAAGAALDPAAEKAARAAGWRTR